MARTNVDMAEFLGAAAGGKHPSPGASGAAGLATGTNVMTLDGAIPVEFLSPGDRIITRSGMRRLVRLEAADFDDLCPCRISAAALGHDRPEADVELGPATPMHIRDWRAAALYGRNTAQVAAAA